MTSSSAPNAPSETRRVLGLPVHRPRAVWASFGLLLGVYTLTMARDLTFYDGPELALVAHQLGVGHPAGQPLHTMVGWWFSHLPGVSPLTGLAFLSALFGAGCIVPTWALADHLTPGSAFGRLRFVALVGVGLSPLAWEPSTRVEVYTLASFLGLYAVALALTGRRPWLAGLAAGLAGGAHLVVGAGQGLAALLLQKRAKAAALTLGLGVLGGLLCYLYVPLAAGDPTRFAWGQPQSVDALYGYVRGADYVDNQGITLSAWGDHLAALAWWGFETATLPLALLGLASATYHSRRLGLAIVAAAVLQVGFVAANVVFHPDVPDYRGYFLAPFWMCGAGLAAATHALASRTDAPAQKRFVLYAGLVAALAPVAVLASPEHLGGPRDQPSLARRLVRGALGELPEDAIVVVESDHWVAPLWYAQEVETQRPDVVIVPFGLASSRWYWDHLFARHPTLTSIPLSGPGGRAGRIARLLAAHPDRSAWVESSRLAQRLGRPVCRVGYLLETTPCRSDVSSAPASRELRGEWQGTPREVVARVGAHRGEALWRLGAGREAAAALSAGLGRLAPPLPVDLPLRAPPLGGPLPRLERPRAALHDPVQNLWALAQLLASMQRPEASAFGARALAR